MRKSRILCIEIFQTTEGLHWQAKKILRVKSEKNACVVHVSVLRETACSVALGQCYQSPVTGHLILGNIYEHRNS